MTPIQLLQNFSSADFNLRVSPMGSAALIRELIRKSPEYAHAKRALDSGLITERTVRRYVSELMRNFQEGHKFYSETALAALAVLVETHFSSFSEELLIDLAALKLPEMCHAIRVARECLQHRIRMPRTKSKTYTAGVPTWSGSLEIESSPEAWKCHTPLLSRTYAIA